MGKSEASVAGVKAEEAAMLEDFLKRYPDYKLTCSAHSDVYSMYQAGWLDARLRTLVDARRLVCGNGE